MISVITVTHNRKEFLSKAIRSVLDQSEPDFEYIIVDDGSTDDTAELVRTFNDKRIQYIYTKRLAHLPSLRNLGLEKATGEIAAFIDSDDLWDKNYLVCLKKCYEDKSILSVVSNAIIKSNNSTRNLFGDSTQFRLKGNLLSQKLLSDKFVIYTSCFSFRNNLKYRFNVNLRYGDNDLFLRILSDGNSEILENPFVTITKHDKNMSDVNEDSSVRAYEEELHSLDVLKAKIPEPVYRKAYSVYQYKLGRSFSLKGLKKEARKNYSGSLNKSFNVKALVRYFFP